MSCELSGTPRMSDDRVQHGGLVVEMADHLAALGVRADHQAHRAVAVHVVGAVLRIVLDDEDARRRPEPARGDRLDDRAPGPGRCPPRMARGVGCPAEVPEVWSLGR